MVGSYETFKSLCVLYSVGFLPLLTLILEIGVTGAVISLYDIGCAIGAMSIGFFADALGRERTLSIASIVFIIGAWLQAASNSISQIVGYELTR